MTETHLHAGFETLYAPPQADGVIPQTTTARDRGQVEGAMTTLGTAGIIFGVVDLVHSLYTVGSSVISIVVVQTMSEELWGPAGGMAELVLQLGIFEIVRMAPFIALSIAMILIGRQLRRHRPKALEQALRWSGWALGSLVVSLLLQMVAATRITAAWLAANGGASGIQWLILGSAVLGTGLMAIWPIVLRRKAGTLRVELVAAQDD